MKSHTKKIAVTLLLLMILGVAIFTGTKVVETFTANKSTVTTKTVVSQQLERSLLERTSLDTVKLNNADKKKLSENNRTLSKRQFIGAFIGVRGNKLVYSWRNGYSNTNPNTSFNINSSILVGSYQTVLDQALLLSLVDQGKIKVTDKLSEYQMKGDIFKKITVKQLLNNESNLYIRKSLISNVQNPKKQSYSSSLFKQDKNSESGWVTADSFIKRMLIANATSQSYENAFDQLIVNKFGLSNTRFFSSKQAYTNDIASYDKKIINDQRVQTKKITIKKSQLKGNTLRMSLADITLLLNGIEKNELFSSKYNSYFNDNINDLNSGYVDGSTITYHATISGQTLAVKSNVKTQRTVVLITNYADSNISLSTRLSELYRIL
ncbi:serine hydrolase [Lactiplantibacillus pentosus]|uniref:serine hydrolase n=1 Tax=Lactiplantibacillus pentosus TaxID=1589 RepID=UPI003C1BF5BB